MFGLVWFVLWDRISLSNPDWLGTCSDPPPALLNACISHSLGPLWKWLSSLLPHHNALCDRLLTSWFGVGWSTGLGSCLWSFAINWFDHNPCHLSSYQALNIRIGSLLEHVHTVPSLQSICFVVAQLWPSAWRCWDRRASDPLFLLSITFVLCRPSLVLLQPFKPLLFLLPKWHFFQSSAPGILSDGWDAKWLPLKALLLLAEPSHTLVVAENSISLWNLRSKNKLHNITLDIWEMFCRNWIKASVCLIMVPFPVYPSFRAEDACLPHTSHH